MVNIMRVTTRWSGFPGAPGYTNLFFRDFDTATGTGGDGSTAQAQSATDRVRTFWTALRGLFPDEVRLDMNPEVDMLEDTTGQLVDSFAVTPGATILGSGTASYAGPVGMVINWRTGGIRNGRRIRGRTFLVPVHNGVFLATGGLNPAETTGVKTAADALLAEPNSPDLGIWARPSAPLATDGQWSRVTGSQVPPLAAVLRSRRD